MVLIDILHEIRSETEQLLEQLDTGASRIYEIDSAGAIVERTVAIRRYYQSVVHKLQRAEQLLLQAEGASAQQRYSIRR